MSFVDRRIETRPKSGAAPLELKEVFFARTDERGVIESCNYLFSRVSHFDWNEIIGAPYNLVRHPDMPSGVFQLIWDTLKDGDAVCAYVKNKSKDGLFYWVFAIMLPVEGGYLSAQITPSSDMFTKMQSMYAELLKLEQNEGVSPQESKEILLTWIQEHGFETYHQFAVHTMSEELISRDLELGNKPDQTIKDLREMLKNSNQLLEETGGLIKDFEAMHTIPHNLRVIASRIEPSGGPITVLSQNYGAMSRDMSDWFERIVVGKNTNFTVIKESIDQSLFVTGMVRILTECGSQLQSERRDLGGIDLETERALLKNLVQKQSARASKGMTNVTGEAQRIINACSVMHRHFLGLSSTRVLCKIESARLPSTGETLSDIIEQLGAFQERISQRLEHIAHLGENIRCPDGD